MGKILSHLDRYAYRYTGAIFVVAALCILFGIAASGAQRRKLHDAPPTMYFNESLGIVCFTHPTGMSCVTILRGVKCAAV